MGQEKKAFTSIQFGFRKHHSTLDLHLDLDIRDANSNNKKVFSVFLDLEKAYDST